MSLMLQTVPVLYAKLILWSVVLDLVLGALGDDDDILILVCCPRPLIGRHLNNRNISIRAFCGSKVSCDAAALLERKMISPVCLNKFVKTTNS